MLSTTTNLSEFFHDKVKEATQRQKIDLSAEVEFYLVNILSHFAKSENLFDVQDDGSTTYRPLALKLHDAIFATDQGLRFGHLKNLADTALYHAGVFYDGLYNNIVDVDYYINLGGTAYRSLATSPTLREKSIADMFHELSEQFPHLVEITYQCVEKEVVHSDHDLLKLLDRYAKTGSQKAKELLQEKGIIPDQVIQSKPEQ